MLELINIYKRYGTIGPKEEDFVLKDVCWKVKAGQSAAITGPSGSGKSTLLNIIGALDKPTSGKVLIEGKDLTKLDDIELASLRNLEIGFVFQLHHLLPQCTVLENVLIPTLAQPIGGNRQKAKSHSQYKPSERAQELLERVGLSHRLHHRPGQLSGGERQRVAMVRALINRPKLLLCDEPTGSLDQAASENLAELMIELNRTEGVTLITASHSLKLAQRMDQIWELNDGQLSSVLTRGSKPHPTEK